MRACHPVSLVSRLPEHLLRLLHDLGSPLLLDDEVLSELEHEHRGVRRAELLCGVHEAVLGGPGLVQSGHDAERLEGGLELEREGERVQRQRRTERAMSTRIEAAAATSSPTSREQSLPVCVARMRPHLLRQLAVLLLVVQHADLDRARLTLIHGREADGRKSSHQMAD